MALEMNSQRGTGDTVEVDAKLWLTKDKDELVPDGDIRAAFLYCTPGKRVPRDEAEQFGIFAAPKAAAPESASAEQETGEGGDVQDEAEAGDEAAGVEQETDDAGEAEGKSQKAPPNKSRSRKAQK